MNQMFLAAKMLLLILLCVNSVSAQISRQATVGLVFSSASSATFGIKGGTGFEIGYGISAKYSDRLEWNTGFSYIKAPYKLDAFVEDNQNEFPNTTYGFKATTIQWNSSMINCDYNLLYYVVPDKVAISAGLIFGIEMDVFNRIKTLDGLDPMDEAVFSSRDLSLVKSNSRIDTKNDPAIADPPNGLEVYPFFNYGLQVGTSYTFQDRFRLFAVYNMYLNHMFDDNKLSEVAGDPQFRLLRIGFTYKFLPSYKTVRF